MPGARRHRVLVRVLADVGAPVSRRTIRPSRFFAQWALGEIDSERYRELVLEDWQRRRARRLSRRRVPLNVALRLRYRLRRARVSRRSRRSSTLSE